MDAGKNDDGNLVEDLDDQCDLCSELHVGDDREINTEVNLELCNDVDQYANVEGNKVNDIDGSLELDSEIDQGLNLDSDVDFNVGGGDGLNAGLDLSNEAKRNVERGIDLDIDTQLETQGNFDVDVDVYADVHIQVQFDTQVQVWGCGVWVADWISFGAGWSVSGTVRLRRTALHMLHIERVAALCQGSGHGRGEGGKGQAREDGSATHVDQTVSA